MSQPSGGSCDAAERNEREYYGEHRDIEPLPFDVCPTVPREVGHIDREGRIVADNGGE